MIESEQKIFRLTGKVQHYEWGGFEFIPASLGISNTSHKPFAEYWLGTHHKSPSEIFTGDEIKKLSEFTDLPYLFKLQDVREMLSIQVHPTKKAAEIEFARENQEHIPLDAPNRNYRDDNHKPELIVALGEFWLLHGFKKKNALIKILNVVPEFAGLQVIFNLHGYEELYKTVMGMPQERVNTILQPLLDRVAPLYRQGALNKDEEDYWASKAALSFNKGGNIDRGIFSIYFFNLVQLKKGEGIYQPAGVPHAYLEGQGVEIMANSDNVLRGGLTTKHIDIKELMKHVLCEPVTPEIISGTKRNKEKVFTTAAPDFELSSFQLAENEIAGFTPASIEIIFLLKGNAECTAGNSVLRLKQGQAAVIFPCKDVSLKAFPDAEIYRASRPVRPHP